MKAILIPILIYNVIPWNYLSVDLMLRIMDEVPGVIGIFFSFTDSIGIGDWSFIGLTNYVAAFSDPAILQSYLFTFGFSIATVLVVNAIAFMLAVGLVSRIRFKTGLRISEFVGLTLSDIDLEHRKINVDHQLQRTMDMRYVIEEPKTSCGKRVIPMTDDVYVCFRRIIENRPRPKNEPMVDGKCGFLFLDQNGNPTVAMHWEHYFNHICTSYNKLYREQLPNITPHVCRHTFCSNMAKSGMNPKTLQYLMGHSDIGVTLNTYTHVQYDDVETEMKRVVNAE